MIKKTHLTKVIHYNILLKIVTFLSLLTVQAVLAAPEVAEEENIDRSLLVKGTQNH